MIDWGALVIGPCVAVFGEPITFRPAAGGAFPITAVFDDAYKALVMQADGDPAIATVDPVLGVDLAQLPAAPVKGDQLDVASLGKSFMVVEVQPDGKGHAKLLLNLV